MDWIDHALALGAPALGRLLEHTSQPLVLLGGDGAIRFSNPAARRMLRFEIGELLGTNSLDLVHPDDRDRVAQTFADVIAQPGLRLSVRLRLRTSAGDWVAVAVEASNLLDVGEVAGVLLSLQDLSELAATEEALASSELRFRDFADRAGDFIFRYRVADPMGFEYVSPVAEALTGIRTESLLADPLLFEALLPDGHADRLRHLDWAAEALHTVEFPLVRADGTRRWVQLRASVQLDGDGGVETIDGIVRDLTDLREQQDDLRRRALHDSLTGLPNRALFYERLEQALRRRDRIPGSPVVLFLDLDGFKAVNDEFGHAAGDGVLVEVGRRVTEVLRPGDTIARLGGDEFLVLCNDTTADADLDALAHRIRSAVDTPMSIGWARAQEGDTADAMVHRADLAMYEGKRVRVRP